MWWSDRAARVVAAEEAEVPVFRNIAIGGVVVGLILILFNAWLGIAVIALSIGIPLAAYLMLDPSQRRRLRRNAGRKQLGR